MKKVLLISLSLLLAYYLVGCFCKKEEGIKPIVIEPDSEYAVTVLPHDTNYIFQWADAVASDPKTAIERARWKAVWKMMIDMSLGSKIVVEDDSNRVLSYTFGILPVEFMWATLRGLEVVEEKVFDLGDKYDGFVLVRLPKDEIEIITPESYADSLGRLLYEIYRVLLFDKLEKTPIEEWLGIEGQVENEEEVLDTLKIIFWHDTCNIEE